MRRRLWLGAASLAAALVGGLIVAGPSAASTASPNLIYQKTVAVRTVAGKAQYETSVSVGVLKPGATFHAASPAGTTYGSKGSCGTDGALTVENCLTLYYGAQVCDLQWCFDVTSATVKYTNDGGVGATLVSGDWVEGVSGACLINCGSTTFVNGTHDFGTHSVSSGYGYSYGGAWNGKYIGVNSYKAWLHGGHSTLVWNYHGVRQSNIVVNYNLPNTP